MPETRRRWKKEDEILALDLYFRVENPSAGHVEVLKTAAFVGCTPASMQVKLMNFRSLHEPGDGLENVSPLSRKTWAKYCHDETWMQEQLKKPLPFGFAEACRDIEKLRRDAAAIIKLSEAEQNTAADAFFITGENKKKAAPKHRWTVEDEILALDLYFRAGVQNDADEEAVKTKNLINPKIESINLKLCNIRHLNLFEPQRGMFNISAQLRKVWAEYCHDKKWMEWRRVKSPPPGFAEACRDIIKLRRDAANIIKRRTPPGKISRREARQEAMRVLYAAMLQNISAADSLFFLRKNQKTAREKMLFADSLLRAIIAAADSHAAEITALLQSAAGRAPELISGVELAVLRAAAAEMLEFPQTKNAVIINEAVEITKQFGAEGGHKIVNGALDKIAAQLSRADA